LTSWREVPVDSNLRRRRERLVCPPWLLTPRGLLVLEIPFCQEALQGNYELLCW